MVFAGGMVSSGLGFVFSVLISRNLGPASFGLYSMAILFVGMASELADMGINAGIVRFASPLIVANEQDRANQILYVSWRWKLTSSMLVFGILFLAAEPIAVLLFGKPDLVAPLRLASIGIFGALLPGFVGAVLQSYNRFGRKVLVDVSVSVAKVAVLGIVVGLGLLTVETAILVFGLVPLLGLGLGMLVSPRGYLRGYHWDRALAGKIFSFSKWVTISTLCLIFLTRMELLILGAISDAYTTGLFAAAVQLALIVRVLVGAMTTVLFPKVAALRSRSQMIQYARRSILGSLVLIVCFIPLIVWSGPALTGIFGPQYGRAAPFFSALMVGYLFAIFINPLSLLMYSLDKPAFLSAVSVIQLPLSLACNLILIRQYGAIGAAYTAVIIRATSTVIIGGGLYYYLRSRDPKAPSAFSGGSTGPAAIP